jgi:DNA-binding transcriptional MerR regulator
MFTIKQLSRMAGITPRTLHYYDEIGLLKPSRVGDNGYRYYGEESCSTASWMCRWKTSGGS